MADYKILSDQELTALLRQGDHTAYTEIYNRYSGVLYLHAYNKLRLREEARDIIQELFTVLWNNHEDSQFTTSLSGYLYRAIQNRIIKLSAYKKVRTSYISAIQEASLPENNITDHKVRERQLAEMIEKEINALPDKMREVFILSRKANMSHKAIAEHLGIAEPTVKKHVNNALKILRTKLSLFAWIVFLIKY